MNTIANNRFRDNWFNDPRYPICKQFCRIILVVCLVISGPAVFAQGTRLLRQPAISLTHIAFTYGGDIWLHDFNNQNLLRLTSTAAVESNPHFSPDGKWIAFNSNRSGNQSVYIVPVEGGTPKRLTWHPSPASVCGWSSDGKSVLYATSRDNAPTGFARLWTVSREGGPSTILNSQWAVD